jgi:hypothetical protein
MRYDDIDPQDIDPETNRPYANYSSPSLDTSFHDHEMAVDDNDMVTCKCGAEVDTSFRGECDSCGRAVL